MVKCLNEDAQQNREEFETSLSSLYMQSSFIIYQTVQTRKITFRQSFIYEINKNLLTKQNTQENK